MSPAISGADLRYIQQRYLDSDDDELIFDSDELPEDTTEEGEASASTSPSNFAEFAGRSCGCNADAADV